MTHKGESRLYSFIIWEKSRKKTDHILDDLKKNFVIRDIYEVRWSKENFVNNLHRFYGLPDVRQKVKVGGTGPFLLILISDPHPRFEEVRVSNEKDIVNVNIYDSKMKYRKWIGGEFVIHSSISEKETNHDLTLLFGKNAQDLEKELPERWNGSIKKLESDLIGHNGWKDMRQLLYVLNGTMKYVVMRNFEDMPDKSDYRDRDVDILAEDMKTSYVIDKDFSNQIFNTHFHFVKIDDRVILFDITYLGGHYFDKKWCKNILKRRVLHHNGFYVPCKEDYFYTLLYHVVFHKRFSDKYKKKLSNLARELGINEATEGIFSDYNKSKEFLEKYMNKMGYRNTTSFQYRIIYTEFQWLVRVSIIIAKTQGIRALFTAILKRIAFQVKSGPNFLV